MCDCILGCCYMHTCVPIERFNSLVGEGLLLYTGSHDYHVCVSTLKAVLTKLKHQHMMPWETQSTCIWWGTLYIYIYMPREGIEGMPSCKLSIKRMFNWLVFSGCVPIAREAASINHTLLGSVHRIIP